MRVQEDLPTRERTLALIVIIVGAFLAVVEGTIVNLALPDITSELNASASQAIWIINAYQLATLALLLPLATLGDRVGYRRVFLVGMVVFVAASAVCAMATSLTTLVLARVLQGVGAAGITCVNMALLRLVFPSHLLGRGIAINSLAIAAASVSGPTIAAGILSVASWPWLFAINIPLGLFCWMLGRRTLPHNIAKASTTGFSMLDVVLNGLMFGLVFLGIDGLGVRTEAGSVTGAHGTPLWLALTELLAGLAVGVFYVRRQLTLPVPLFPVDLLRIPVFALSVSTSVATFCAHTLANVGLPFLLLGPYGRSHIEAGLLLTAWPISLVVMTPIAGRLIGRIPGGVLGCVGLGLMTLGLLLLAVLPAQPTDADIIWRLALCGAGFGLFQSPNNHAIISSAPVYRTGSASGMLGTARLTGQTLGAVLLAIIFSLFGTAMGQGPLVALWLAAAFAALAGIFSALRIRQA